MRLQRAQALAQQGDLPGALAVLEQATPGERAGVQSFQVDLLKALDRKEEALVIRRAQAAAMPGSVVAQHNLASSLGDTGRNVEAVEAGLQAVKLRPQDMLAWSSLSLFHVRNNQIKEAEAAGGKARILSWGGKIKTDS
jgi:predicted Zn-dependent protease